MATFSVSGSQFNFLHLDFAGKVTQSNTVPRFIRNGFTYRWDGVGAAPGVGQKAGLVTTAMTGFKAVVANILLAAYNNRWTSIGVFARWLDVYTDQFTLPSAFATAGSVMGDCLPLEDCVTIRKGTGQRGKNYRGSWHFACANESDIGNDELSGTGITNWVTNLRPALVAPINDGISNFKPVLISSSLSNQKLPLPLVLAGADIATVLINATIGGMKKRKERPTITL